MDYFRDGKHSGMQGFTIGSLVFLIISFLVVNIIVLKRLKENASLIRAV
jgi:hypothetical protein